MNRDADREPTHGPVTGGEDAPSAPALAASPVTDSPASACVRTSESLDEVIARLESDASPHDEFDFRAPFNALRSALDNQGAPVSAELAAEEIAYSVHAHDRQDASTWGLYSGPFMSWSTPSGESFDSPLLASMTPQVLRWRAYAGIIKVEAVDRHNCPASEAPRRVEERLRPPISVPCAISSTPCPTPSAAPRPHREAQGELRGITA